jgi:alkylated DNA repair dioxygenase AlkB
MKALTCRLVVFLSLSVLISCANAPELAETPGSTAAITPTPAGMIQPTKPVPSPTTGLPAPAPSPTGPDSLHVIRIGSMPVERAAHQATLLKTGHVLVTGGCAGRGCDLVHASVALFDPAIRSFATLAPMNTPRAGHAAILLPDGRVLVSGGWTGQRTAASAEIYDPVTGLWTAVGDMTEARESHIAAPLADGRVLMMGGGADGRWQLASAEVFDPATAAFSPVGRMQTNHYLATVLADGRVLVTGGRNDAGEILPDAEIFDPATGEFRPTGEMLIPRVKHAAVLLADGRVLIIGGSDNRGYSERFTSTEIYDPTTETFAPGPDLGWGRHKIRDAVVRLPSGAVLVTGGAARLELFKPADRVFVPVAGDLSGPQMFATATLLATGDVLVLGGYDEHTQPSDAAWLVLTGG